MLFFGIPLFVFLNLMANQSKKAEYVAKILMVYIKDAYFSIIIIFTIFVN